MIEVRGVSVSLSGSVRLCFLLPAAGQSLVRPKASTGRVRSSLNAAEILQH